MTPALRKSLPFIGIAILFIAFSLLNIPIITTFWRHGFDDGTYSHAFLIPFISLFLYFKLNQIGKLTFNSKPNSYFLAFLLICTFSLYITSFAQISIGYWSASLLVLLAAIISLYRFNWYIVFPTLYLAFIIPFWGGLTGLLQSMSVASVSFIMSFTGIPTYVEAQYVSIPAGTFEIAHGCSGLRYIIVSLAISALYSFLFIKGPKRAFFFLAVAIIGGLLTNWLRITILILIGHETDMTHSLMNDHNSFGWYIYIPFMFLLYMLGNKLTNIDLFHQEEQQATNVNATNSINALSLLFVTFMLIFSSTTLHSTFSDKEVNKVHSSDISPANSPKIYFYSNVDIYSPENLPAESTHQIYNYKRGDLDGKPTYFNNEYIPQGWAVISEFEHQKWRNLHIKSGAKQSLVSYSFQLGKLISSSKKEFKLARLKSVFMEAEPKLHWIFIPCRSNCQQEKDLLLTHISP